jgi:hypothetical protein
MPCIGQAYVVQELVGLSDASKLEWIESNTLLLKFLDRLHC